MNRINFLLKKKEDDGIPSHHFIANTWGNNYKLHFLGLKNHCILTTATKLKDTCSLEDSYDKPRQCIKIRDITLPTNVPTVKVMAFTLLTYGCESWTIKKAEHWRINAFEVWCWRRLLRVPWTERKSNQSILKEINSEYSLEGLMLRLKLQYFGHLMRRAY